MSEFDWMLGKEFKDEIRNQVKKDAGRYGMEKYQSEIGERLVSYLEKYREPLIESEIEKASYQRKKKVDALASIDILMENACEYAKKDNRTTVTVSDFEKAYEAKFCSVWPFCGMKK